MYDQRIATIEDMHRMLSAIADDGSDDLYELVKVLLRSDEAQDTILEAPYVIPVAAPISITRLPFFKYLSMYHMVVRNSSTLISNLMPLSTG